MAYLVAKAQEVQRSSHPPRLPRRFAPFKGTAVKLRQGDGVGVVLLIGVAYG